GTNRTRFFRGEVDKYTWVGLGSSYLPSELVAAFLLAQLEHADEILVRRRAIFARYHDELSPLEAAGFVRLPIVPPDCVPNGHIFYIIVESEGVRDELLAYLDAAGVNAVFHYVPLHESPEGRRRGRCAGEMTNTESASRRLLRLPCYFALSEEQQDRVIDLVRRFFGAR
ncbi:MAG TPA: DegT/DnrJ/EryC1/StrS family aminotransferase, partial [Thermoanaerobaculia bacterium]